MIRFAIILGGMVVIAALINSDPAVGQSGEQTINGTRVYTEIDQARGVATFSNQCGSQTLTQQELQAGAIPSQIIPCPRPHTASKSQPANIERELKEFQRIWEELRAGPTESDKRKWAEEYYSEGSRQERKKNWTEAFGAYGMAMNYYKELGDKQKEGIAHKAFNRVDCNRYLASYNQEQGQLDVATRIWRLEGAKSIFGCGDFPNAVKYIDEKLAELKKGAVAGPRSGGGASRDTGAGHVDAAQCIRMKDLRRGAYKLENSCTFGVRFVLQTTDYGVSNKSQDVYSLGPAPASLGTTSKTPPVVLKACAQGAPRCNLAKVQ
jgi:hypothetical protein